MRKHFVLSVAIVLALLIIPVQVFSVAQAPVVSPPAQAVGYRHSVTLNYLQVNNSTFSGSATVDNKTFLGYGTIIRDGKGHPGKVTLDYINICCFCLAPISSGLPASTQTQDSQAMPIPQCGGGGGGGGGSTSSTNTVTNAAYPGSYAEWPVYLKSPPYPCFCDPPTVHLYLTPAVAIDVGVALAAATILLGAAAAVSGGISVVLAVVTALLSLSYAVMYATDGNPDHSFDTYWPYDWFNILFEIAVKSTFAATPHFWWFLGGNVLAFVVATCSCQATSYK